MSSELTLIMAGAALAIAGWALREVSKIEPMEANVNHIRERVDALYDHLLGDSD